MPPALAKAVGCWKCFHKRTPWAGGGARNADAWV
jgi:hypothetical protein